jgi:rhodanese-related sulfurtransferase
MKKTVLMIIGLAIACVGYAENLDDSCAACTVKLAMNSENKDIVKNDQGYTPAPKRDKIREISIDDLYKKVKNPGKNLMLINVLGERFYNDCHIKLPDGVRAVSISAPLRIFEEKAQEWDKDKEIIVYCACIECDASYKAYKKLIALGFRNVTAYEGGIRQWWQTYNEKDPSVIEGPCVFPFLKQKKENTSRTLVISL